MTVSTKPIAIQPEFRHGERRGQAQHGTDLFAKAGNHALGCALS